MYLPSGPHRRKIHLFTVSVKSRKRNFHSRSSFGRRKKISVQLFDFFYKQSFHSSHFRLFRIAADNKNRASHSCTHGGNYCNKLDCFLGFLPAAAFTEEQNIKIFGKRHYGIGVFSVIDHLGILLFYISMFFLRFSFLPVRTAFSLSFSHFSLLTSFRSTSFLDARIFISSAAEEA